MAARARDPYTCSTGGTRLNFSPYIYPGVIPTAARSEEKTQQDPRIGGAKSLLRAAMGLCKGEGAVTL